MQEIDNAAALLAEIEDVIRTMPPRAVLRQDVPEAWSWLGHALSTLSRWDFRGSERARDCVRQKQDMMATTAQQGYIGLMVVPQEARSSLRFQTLGPVNSAIGQGAVFDYFDESYR